jgi:hypothetical protein
MKNRKTPSNQIPLRILLIASIAAVGAAFTVSLPPAHAANVKPPPVAADIQVPVGNEVFLKGHAVGTQDYICLPAASGVAWTFFAPQATLFNDEDQQVVTHFLSPNPRENGVPRATWQGSRDTGTVWGKTIASSSDSAFVAAGSIPWLLLQVVGAQVRASGGDELSKTTFIQRLNTAGGAAPSTGCTQADVGKGAFVPYTADYFFYRQR